MQARLIRETEFHCVVVNAIREAINVGTTAKAATPAVKGLGVAIRNLFIGYQAIQGLKFVFGQNLDFVWCGR